MKVRIFLSVFASFVVGSVAWAASDSDRIAELERKVEALTRQDEKSQFSEIFIPAGESVHGLGPSASKIYLKDGGLSFGGYGEALYQNFDGDKVDQADFLRAILYVGYKFDDQWVLNTEFEFEHASTGEDGSVSVEFATLDYLHTPALNFRAGLVLVPVGIVNKLHEPTVFLSARRPDVESRIIPTTWRENGIGIFGELADGIVHYKAYLVNGMDGSEFSAKGLRGGRQKGSKSKAEDFAGVLRLDVSPVESLTVGGSLYHGNSGQDVGVDAETTLAQGHLIFVKGGLDLRMLYVEATVDDVAELNRIIATSEAEDGLTPMDSDISSIGERLVGGYVQVGYNVLHGIRTDGLSLTPYVRWEKFNTQDSVPSGFATSASTDEDVLTYGLNVKPRDGIVFKAEFQAYSEAADQWNLAMGYNF